MNKTLLPRLFAAGMTMLALALPASACLNEATRNHRGEHVEPMGYSGPALKYYLRKGSSRLELDDWTRQATQDVRKSPSFDNLITLSAVLIRNGKLQEAVTLLQFLERKYPGNYQTASNMGTAYELLRNNEEALKWISEGLKRNPDDHYGTEWLHVQILKSKLKQLPASTYGRSILNLDFGDEAMPRRPAKLPVGNDGKQLSLYGVGKALRYQMLERIEFVDSPNPLVAGLLLDWANMELLAGTVESADVLYDAALRYGSLERRIITLRKAEVAKAYKMPAPNTRINPVQCELCAPSANDQATPLQPNSR